MLYECIGFQQLRDKNQAISESDAFSHYSAPIERTSWIKKAMVKAHSGELRAKWESSMVELEQTGNPQGGIDFGTLSIFGTSKRSKVSQVELDMILNVSRTNLTHFEIFRHWRTEKCMAK